MNLFLIIAIFWVVSEIGLSRWRRSKDSQIDYDRSSLKILWITITISITLGFILKDTGFLLTDSDTAIIQHAGISMICLGLIVRWIAIIKLKKSFTVNVALANDQKLIQSGIYKYIRHPSYLGSLLSFLGLGIAFNNWITVIIIFIPILLSFLYRIQVEEKVLQKAYSQLYDNYVKTSWKLIPKVF